MLCEFKQVIFVVNAQQCLQQLPQAFVSFSLPYTISPQMYFLSGLLLKSETVWNTFCRNHYALMTSYFTSYWATSNPAFLEQVLGRPSAAWLEVTSALGPLEYFRLTAMTGDFLTTGLGKGILPRNSFWNQPTTTQACPTSTGLLNSNWMSQDCQEYTNTMILRAGVKRMGPDSVQTEQGTTNWDTGGSIWIGRQTFTLRVTEHWKRLPREIVKSPSLETFKTHLDENIIFDHPCSDVLATQRVILFPDCLFILMPSLTGF